MSNKKALSELTKREYNMLVNMGVLIELYPNATGDFEEDSKQYREVKVYIHSDSESLFDKGKSLGLSDEASCNFSRCAYEVELLLNVDMNTGNTSIIGVDGTRLT